MGRHQPILYDQPASQEAAVAMGTSCQQLILCVVQEPSALDSCGRPWLKFGKLLAGRESQLLLNVRNNGLLPASARLEMEPSPAFTLVEGTQVDCMWQGLSFTTLVCICMLGGIAF